MSTLTLAISLGLFAVCVVAQPRLALVAYISAAILWPEYMRVDTDPIQLSAHRIGAIGLILGAMLRMRSTPRFHVLDALFVGWWAWVVAANLIMGSQSAYVTTAIGRGLDTALVYAAVRLSLMSAGRTPGVHPLLVFSAGLATALAMYESYTHSSVYDTLFLSDPSRFDYPMYRHGFLRAKGSTAQPIYWGVAMLLVAGLLLVYGARRWGLRVWLAVGVALLGCLFSWSAGPWVGGVVMAAALVFYWAPWAVKPAVWIGAVGYVLLEIFANRNVYEFSIFLGLDRQTAWYRGRLIDVAIMKLPEYWMFGYGSESILHWAPLLDGRNKVDVVNNYIHTAIMGGLLAFALYTASKIACLVCAVKLARSPIGEYKRQGYALAAILIAVSVVEFSVGLFSTPMVLHAVLLAHGPSLLHLYQADQRRLVKAAGRRVAAPAPRPDARATPGGLRGAHP